MIRNESELNSRLEEAVKAVSPKAAQLYGNYAPLLATKVDARWRERAERDWTSGMFENRLHHSKFVHACLVLQSHRCLVEVLHWAYGAWVARGLDAGLFRMEFAFWRDVVQQEMGNRAEAMPLIQLYELLLRSHEVFCQVAAKGLGDPFQGEDLPDEARRFLCALLIGKEPRVNAPKDLGEAIRYLPRWWEHVVSPALHTVGKLWSDGCITVAEEHVATGIAQQVLRRSFPAVVEQTKEETVAVVVPAGEWHTVGAEMVRDFLRLQGYRVFYTGANTPLDGFVPMLRWNDVSYLLVSSTIASELLTVSEMVEQVKAEMGDQRPRIVVGGQAYRLNAGLGERVGADVCLQGLGELAEYMVRESRGRKRLNGCDGEHPAGSVGARVDSDIGGAAR